MAANQRLATISKFSLLFLDYSARFHETCNPPKYKQLKNQAQKNDDFLTMRFSEFARQEGHRRLAVASYCEGSSLSALGWLSRIFRRRRLEIGVLLRCSE